MRKVAEDVWQLSGFPRNMFNVYLMEDVLIDAATRWAKGRVHGQLRGRKVRMVALTHCHPDHQGVAAFICDQRRIPLACHQADVLAMEGRGPMLPDNQIIRLGVRVWAGPPRRVDQALQEGDRVAGFRVVHLPGHTPGHICFFRDADRVAIAGDVLANMHFLRGTAGLREPPPFFCDDPALNRQSILKLLELRPRVVCFGHGPPLHDLGQIHEFVTRRRITPSPVPGVSQSDWAPLSS